MKAPLNLEEIRVLDAIERKGSFAAAALELHKVPSAVSYTMQKLEEHIGTSLFEKQGRRAVLTNAGRLLVERGRQLLSAADDLLMATQQVATGWEPRLRIAVDTLVPIEVLLPRIAGLYELQPNIDISLSTEVLGGTWEALQEHRVDLVVGGIQGVPSRSGITCEPWLSIEHAFVAAPAHPICRAPLPLCVNEIKKHRAVVIRDTSRNSAPLSRGILDEQHYIHVAGMADKLQAHRCGLGVGFVPVGLAARYLASGELVQLEVETQKDPDVFMLAWKTSNTGRALTWLVEQLREDVGKITQKALLQ